MHLSGVAVEILMLDGKVDVRLRGKDTRDQAVQRIRKALLKASGSGKASGGSGKTPKFGLKSVGKRSGELLKRDSQAGASGSPASPGAAAEEALVLVLQLEDGSQRALEADELPLKLLDKRRKLWFVPPTAVLRAPVLLAPEPKPPEAPVAEQPKPPPPPPPAAAVTMTATEATAEVVECAAAEVPLSSVLRLNAAREDFGAVQSVLAQHPWLTQVPVLYTFALEARALDEVNASDARDLRRAQLIDAALRKPPTVNRRTKPK